MRERSSFLDISISDIVGFIEPCPLHGVGGTYRTTNNDIELGATTWENQQSA